MDYGAAERRRRENFRFLHERLGASNALRLQETGTYMYPYYAENGAALREALQKEGFYIPTLWPAVFALCEKGEQEYRLAENVLPLPIDQRYGAEEMEVLVSRLKTE